MFSINQIHLLQYLHLMPHSPLLTTYIHQNLTFSTHNLTLVLFYILITRYIIMSSLVCFLLYLYFLHACSGRPFGVFVQENSTRIQLSAKDVKTPGAEKFVMQGNFRAEFGDKTFYGANNMKLKDQKAYLVKEAEDIKGNEVKMPYFGKIFEETAEKKEWKREERSTLESPPKKAKKNIISKESDSIEEIVVMDYAQPHRKPPIHNKEP